MGVGLLVDGQRVDWFANCQYPQAGVEKCLIREVAADGHGKLRVRVYGIRKCVLGQGPAGCPEAPFLAANSQLDATTRR
jgi:hypothetical protein